MDVIFRRLYGKPVNGKSGNIAFDGTDKTAALEAGGLYGLYATAECLIAVDDLATTAANQMAIPMGQIIAFMPSATGDTPAPVLHVTQMSGPGTLYYFKLDEAR